MIISNKKEFNSFLKKLGAQEEVVLDTETTGLKVWGADRLCGLGFSFNKGKDRYYLPFRHKRFDPGMGLFAILEDDMEDINLPLDWMQDIWVELKKVNTIIGHNIKFDLAVMTHDGYEVPAHQKIEDTLSGARIYFPDKRDSLTLENLVHKTLGQDLSQWKAVFDRYLDDRNINNHFDQAEVHVLGDYCEKDCSYTFQAREKLIEYAESTEQSEIYSTEREVVTLLWHLERAGLKLDLDYITHAIKECSNALAILDAEITKVAKIQINPWSAPNVDGIMNELGQKTIARTPTGEASWADEVLKKVVKKGANVKVTKFAKLILNWRKIDKMMNTFFIPYSASTDGYVHPNFKPWGAITGRFACSDPNLQQVSKTEDWDIECLPDFDIQVRRMFVAPEGYKLLMVDYSQMEMIGFADYLNDAALTEELNKGDVDYHTLAKDLILKHAGVELERKDSKAVSLGLIYGMGKDKLARRLEKSVDEAQNVKRAFFTAFPTAQPFIESVHRRAKQRGYVFNRYGRRYYIPEEHVYAAVNYLVQGTCADIIKRALVRLANRFKAEGWKTRLAAQMHDEFLIYIKNEEWDAAVRAVIEIMEDVDIMKTKLFVEASIADLSWADKKKLCKKCLTIKQEEHKCLK